MSTTFYGLIGAKGEATGYVDYVKDSGPQQGFLLAFNEKDAVWVPTFEEPPLKGERRTVRWVIESNHTFTPVVRITGWY